MRTSSIVRALVALIMVGAGFAATASSASAATDQGELVIKGPGSLYGGPGSLVSLSVGAGAAASFAFEVRNTGTTTAQFNVRISHGNNTFCAAVCTSSAVVTSGSTNITSSITGPHGYFTVPLAPKAIVMYTLKITVAKAGATPGDNVGYQLQLGNSAGSPMGPLSLAYNHVALSTGTGAADQFVGASGTAPTSGNPSTFGSVTAPSVAAGKTFTFSIKLKNDSTTPAAISYSLSFQDGECAAYFPFKLTQASGLGSTNVTSAVVNGTYTTAKLAHGASVTLTLTGTSLTGGEHCLQTLAGGGFVIWYGAASSGQSSSDAYLSFSPEAI